jgi:predicted TIM-barrel fold metal-dependent hydrolase
MVFSGFFERLPNLKIIVHHLGSMIPFFEGRIGAGWDDFGARTPGPEGERMTALRAAMKRPPIEHFRHFYADTAQHTSTTAIRCGHEFYEPNHVMFGTDCPFDPEGGSMWIREISAAIDRLDLPEAERQKIFAQNALDLLRLQPPRPRAKT